VRSALAGVPVSRIMRKTPLSVPPTLSLERLVQDYFYTYMFKSFPVAADGRLVGYINVNDIRKVNRDEWPFTTVNDVMEPCSDENTVGATTDTVKALQQMRRTGKSRLLVVEEGKLVGVLALRDLMDFLAIKAELGGIDLRAPQQHASH
jgi:CBS domain-containing protein